VEEELVVRGKADDQVRGYHVTREIHRIHQKGISAMLVIHRALQGQTRLIVSGIAGALTGLFILFRLAIPTWEMLPQLSQLSPLDHLFFLVKLFSPLISLLLTTGWVWVLLASMPTQLSLPPSGTSRNVSKKYHEFAPSSRGRSLRYPASLPQRVAVPPLFQLDPADPQITHLDSLALTFNPHLSIHPGWMAQPQEAKSSGGEEVNDIEVPEKEHVQAPATNHMLSSAVETLQEQRQNEPQGLIPTEISGEFPLQASRPMDQATVPIVLSLLKRMQVKLLAPDGTTWEVKLRGGKNAIRLILLAYIAWRKGESVDRDKLLTHVLARGSRQDMDTIQLSEAFDAAKKYLREDLKRAVSEINKQAGQELISPQSIDFFSNEPGFYWLHQSCRVTDLEEIEKHYRIIRMARKDGLLDEKLDGSIPDWVIESCQQLIGAYCGDFLEELIGKFPEEFGSWVKEPFTLYRDMYLDALWIMATHESALGRNSFSEYLTNEKNEEQRRHHRAKAAQLFYDYALYAMSKRADSKLKFAYRAGKDGERVIMSERAIRRCAVELGKIGKTDMIDQVYLSYKDRMSSLSEGHWKPNLETERDVADAKRQTNAYRFSTQMPTKDDRSNEKQG